MNANDTATVNGTQHSKTQCFLQSLRYEPGLRKAWAALKPFMDADEVAAVDVDDRSSQGRGYDACCHVRCPAKGVIERLPRLGGYHVFLNAKRTECAHSMMI